MPKLRKQRRRKVYRHNVNRKRLRNKVTSVGNIDCKEIKTAWDNRKSVQTNLEEMGLSYDPNETLKIPNSKKELKKLLNQDDWKIEEIEEPNRPKKHVTEALEAEATAPRESRFRLPKGQVEWLSYLILKYGKDYKAMARDNKNYYQETWKQLRQKIRVFKRIPAQYNKFLEENNITVSEGEEPDVSDDEV